MGSTNFIQFDASKTNMQDDTQYSASSATIDGVVPGIAASDNFNKFAYQVSTFPAAFTQVMANAGLTVSDASLSGLQTSITDFLATLIPQRYNTLTAITYVNTHQISIPAHVARDDANTATYSCPGETVDFNVTGLNGMAQSAYLGGTVSASNGGTTVTGSGTTFTADFIVGDTMFMNGTPVVGSRITAIASDTSLTVENPFTATYTSVQYKRGNNVGETTFNIYAITNGTTQGYLLTTRNLAAGQTVVDIPSGYSIIYQLPATFYVNTSSNLEPFDHFIYGPHSAVIKFKERVNMLTNVAPTTYTLYSLWDNGYAMKTVTKRVSLSLINTSANNGTFFAVPGSYVPTVDPAPGLSLVGTFQGVFEVAVDPTDASISYETDAGTTAWTVALDSLYIET